VPITLPPRREHREDVPALVAHFLRLACRDNGKRLMRIEPSAVSLLMQYEWPGNVRELRNSIERLVILASEEMIRAADVQECLPGVKPTRRSYRQGVALRDLVATAEREIILEALEAHGGQVARAAEALQLERSHLYKKLRALGIALHANAEEEPPA